LYAQDHEIAASLSMQAFRTSVELARIEPCEGMFDEKEIEHYIKVFDDAKNRGLKVFATIIHFTVPLWFEEKGSFSDADNLKYFERFLEKIVPAIAPYVDFWNVLNEFNLSPDYSFKVNCILAHARGYHVIKKYSSAPVSTAHAMSLRC
jgi:beta-glucosidase